VSEREFCSWPLRASGARKNAGVSRVDFCLGRVGVQVRLNMNSNKAVQHVSLQFWGPFLPFFLRPWIKKEKPEAPVRLSATVASASVFKALLPSGGCPALSPNSLSLLWSPLADSATCEPVKAAGVGQRASLTGVPDIVF
jgi:hypothetical protein